MTGAIDILCNLFTEESIQKNWYGPEEFQYLIKWWHMEDRVKGIEVDDFVSMMDEAGVSKVLIPAVRMMAEQKNRMIWDITEEEVNAVVQKYPDRFVGIAGYNPYTRLEGVRKVERAVKDWGFRGVYIHTYGFGIPLNHRLYYPLYAKCSELGIAVSMQVGHSAERMPSELGRPIALDDIAIDFPELKIVGAHTGWPWTEEMIALAWKHENVFLGIDAHAPQYLEETLVNFIKSRGKRKVLWGTNFPAVLHKDAVSYIREHMGLKEDVAQLILHDNAARVYGLD